MESWKPKMNLITHKKTCEKSNNNNNVSSSSNNPACPRHPNHIQSPGVCSLCLTEKLSQLPLYSGRRSSKHPRCSPSSSHSFLSSRTTSSPRMDHHQDKTKSGGGVLKKSRSLVFFTWRKKEKDDEKNVVEPKRGIWSRLLRRKNNNNCKGELMHSRTTRESLVAAAPVH